MTEEFNLGYISEDAANVLLKLSKIEYMNRFVFVGGSALAIIANHRISEDLDFIFPGDKLDQNKIENILRSNFKDVLLVKKDGSDQLDFIVNKTKITFFTSAIVNVRFDLKKFTSKFNYIEVGDPVLIAMLKINAITHRNTIKDYYDLYFISKNFIRLSETIKNCRKLLPDIPEITYSETLIYTDDLNEDVSDLIRPVDSINKNHISEFFENELKTIN